MMLVKKLPKKYAQRRIGQAIIGAAVMSLLLTTIGTIPAFAQPRVSLIDEHTYDTEDGMFRVHYNRVDEKYAKFVGHAFSKARQFQLALGFSDITLTRTTHDSEDGRVAIYVKDLIYDGKAAEAVIGQNQLQYFEVSDNLEKSQIYLAAANEYFKAVEASYNTLGYEASEEDAWINDGIAKFITFYTAMNDPEYKQYDEEYKQYGYLNKVMVDGKKAYGYASYEVPRITSDTPLQNGITKLGELTVSYWYYLHKLYGMKIIQDVITRSGSYSDDSVKVVSSLLRNHNSTFVQSIAEWYESIGFWNKGQGKIGDFSVYEGLMLVNDEVFTNYKSSEFPMKVENQLMRYSASFVKLEFDSSSPIVQLRFLNPSESVFLYVYIHNVETDEYYYQQIQEVEKGYVDFWVWTANAEISFIVIGGDNSFRGGFTIAAV